MIETSIIDAGPIINALAWIKPRVDQVIHLYVECYADEAIEEFRKGCDCIGVEGFSREVVDKKARRICFVVNDKAIHLLRSMYEKYATPEFMTTAIAKCEDDVILACYDVLDGEMLLFHALFVDMPISRCDPQ